MAVGATVLAPLERLNEPTLTFALVCTDDFLLIKHCNVPSKHLNVVGVDEGREILHFVPSRLDF